MSAALRDLLEKMREHPAFPELLKAVPAPSQEAQEFKPTSQTPGGDQIHLWIHRSGRAHQQRIWLDFLQNAIPPTGG